MCVIVYSLFDNLQYRCHKNQGKEETAILVGVEATVYTVDHILLWVVRDMIQSDRATHSCKNYKRIAWKGLLGSWYYYTNNVHS